MSEELMLATKDDLKNMYQRILPYLGGMPEMLANKFSKGDLYSTDERIIGQWIDGKPVYQKVIIKTNITISAGVDINNIELFTGVETLVQATGYIQTNNSSIIYLPWIGYFDITASRPSVNSWYRKADGTVSLCIQRAESNLTCPTLVNILQYTKTTDSAIAIGSDTDYSTEEKIIGTWIDGRPVYQKTINFGGLPNATSKSVAHGISNLDFVTSIEAVAKSTQDVFMPLPLCYESGNTGNNTSIQVNQTSVKLTTNGDISVYTNSYITLRYIKTS